MTPSLITTTSAAFDRGTDPILGLFSVEQARRLVDYRGDESLQRRIEELAQKSNEGDLSDEEQAEYEGYVRANKFIAIFDRQRGGRRFRSPAAAVRLGVCYYLLGRYAAAIQTLKSGDGGAPRHFYLAKTYYAQGQYDEAIAAYAAAAKAGYNADDCALGRAEAQRIAGDNATALQTLDSLSGAVEQTAEYLYQRGATVSALGGNPTEVVALFERAVEADPNHAGALFGLAKENDRRGNDEIALDLYERSVAQFPTYVGTLLNLGVLYEDRQQYDRAQQCYQRILDVYPNHARARLFLKDAQASGDMYYDEDAQRKRDRASQVLSIPVTDFELSVRSRNCLQKMGIMTLGDLARCTEQELLASKNFGETSLVEIRDMLASKGTVAGAICHVQGRARAGFRAGVHVARRTGDAGSADRRSEPLGAGPQVHDPPGPEHDRRAGAAHGRRPAGVQELRRHEPQRGAREADAARPQAARRLIHAATRTAHLEAARSNLLHAE